MDEGEMIIIRKKKIFIVLSSVLMVLTAMIAFTSCIGPMGGAFNNSTGETQDGMETFEVVRGNISQEISVTGSIDSESYTTYNLQVSGDVLAALEVGDTFKEGDLLVEIDDKEEQDVLFEMEKNIETAESSLRLAKLSYQSALDSNHIAIQQAEINTKQSEESTANALRSLENAITSAELAYESAETAIESAEELARLNLEQSKAALEEAERKLAEAEADPATTPEELAQYEYSVETARKSYEIAEAQQGSSVYNTELSLETTKNQNNTSMDSAQSSYDQSLLNQSSTYWSNLSSKLSAEAAIKQAAESLKQSEIKLELAKVEYENTEEDLEDYTVYAPYDGIVVSIDFTAGGEEIEGGSISIISNKFIVDCMISESDIVRVYAGQEAEIDFDAYPDIKFSGEVKKIIPVYIEDSGIIYYEVLVSFDNNEDIDILYGFSANISIIDIKAENVLYVPLQAVYKEEGKSYVDVLVSGLDEEGEAGQQTIRKTEITTGVNDYYNIEVISGLKEGDIIITSRI
jgi:HlyD family secretion protein